MNRRNPSWAGGFCRDSHACWTGYRRFECALWRRPKLRRRRLVSLIRPASNPVPAPPPPPSSLPPAAMNPPVSADQWLSEPPVSFVVPGGPRPGFFGAVDLSLLFPHVQHNVVSTVPINYNVVFIDFPPFAPAAIDRYRESSICAAGRYVAPKFTLGWRFRGERGGIQSSPIEILRVKAPTGFPISTPPATALYAAGSISTKSASTTRPANIRLAHLWSMRWEVGGRLATIYHDSQGVWSMLGQKTSNFFIGAGPQAALDLTREIPDTGFALFSRLDARRLYRTD